MTKNTNIFFAVILNIIVNIAFLVVIIKILDDLKLYAKLMYKDNYVQKMNLPWYDRKIYYNKHSNSTDVSKKNYHTKFQNKNTGFIVEEKYPHLKRKWKLYTGDKPCKFIEDIGSNIDFVLIDTVHGVLGEFLNFLGVFKF